MGWKTTKSRIVAAAAAMVVAATTLTACGSSGNPLSGGSAKPSASGGAGGSNGIVVGSANFTESEVLADLYAQAMTAKGVKASTHLSIGSRELYLRALKDGSISVVPEYTGNLLQYLDPKTTASTQREVEEQLPKVAQKKGFDVLATTQAVDQDVYVVSQATAKKYGLKSLADLKKIPNLQVGGPTELKDRPYGPQGLKGMYGVTAHFTAYDSPALKVKDLKSGKIQAADFFTTDAAIADNGFVKLTDPQTMILPQNVVPLVRPDVKKNSAAVDAMNAVGKQLTTEDLAALNKKVDVDHADAADVAKDWLSSKGLV